MNGLLFDKIINVSLYRQTQTVDPQYKVCNPSIFTSSKKLIRAEQGENIIEFYRGRTRRIITGYKPNGSAVYTEEVATGPLYVVRTLEEMKRGVTPQGVPFQSGARIRVREDNSMWNVRVSGSTESFYTEPSTYEVPETVISFSTPDHGVKPNISLDVNLIPGQNCYAAVLRITNFNLNPIEIRTWNRMRITAGYLNGNKIILDCPIFTSYIETPNPDGVTVFEGVTIGAVENVMVDKYTIIEFIQESMSLPELIKSISRGIAGNLKLNVALGQYEKADKYTINITKQKVYAQNGAAVLNWLQNTLSDYIRNASNQQDDVFVQLHDGILDVILLSGETLIKDIDSAIDLDMITSASFSGPSLNIIAPWNPQLIPGKLFYMPPYYFNGHELPNSMPTDTFHTLKNLYRVITMSISFSTSENINKMTVLALPAYNAEEKQQRPIKEMTADTYAKMEAETYRIENRIQVGEIKTGDLLPLPEDPDVQTKTGVAFIDNNSNILQKWTRWVYVDKADYTGTCTAELVSYYLTTMLGGPRLTKNNIRYKPSRNDLNTFGKKYYMSAGISAVSLWWPLAALGTYWQRQRDIKQEKDTNYTSIRADNLNYVEDNTKLLVPVFTSWTEMKSTLTSIKDIWKQAYLDYGEVDPGVRMAWKTMYYYLGGEGEF